jgi:hypothetical protein
VGWPLDRTASRRDDTVAAVAAARSLLLVRGARRDGLRSALLLAVCGIAFAAWQAPAPRFLYAFVIVVPALALMGPFASAKLALLAPGSDALAARRAATGFLSSAVVGGLAYAVASQKLNVWSAINGRALLEPNVPAELVVPQPRHNRCGCTTGA